MSKKIVVNRLNKKKFSGLTSNLWLILMFIIGLYWLISADFSNAAVAQSPNGEEALLNRHKMGEGKLTQQEGIRFHNVSLTASNLTGANEATELAFDPVAIAEQSRNIIHPAPGDQIRSQVAYNSDDDEYLVVWQDFRSETDWDIYGQRVGNDGSLLGENIVINAAAYNQQFPQIAYGNGVYLIAWRHYPDSSINYYDAYGQIISATGELTGSVLLIANRSGYADREAPTDIVYNSGSEKFLVLWSDLRSYYWNIWGRHVVATGAMDAPVQITFINSQHENEGKVAYNPDDDQYLIIWEHRQSSSSHQDIRGRRMTGGGVVNNSETIYIATGSNQQSSSSIAYLDTAGQYTIVWEDDAGSDYDIYGQAVLPNDGSLNGGNYVIEAATGDERFPELTMDGDNIVWQRQNEGDDGWDLYSRELDGYGLPITDSFAVVEAVGNQERVAVATGNSDISYFLAWQDDRGGDWDVCVSFVPSLAVANNDFYTALEDNVLTVISATGVISNDIGSSPLSVTVDIDVSNGGLNLDLNGGFVYTPALDFNGIDTFSYILSDGVLTDTATVTITVTAVNDPPIAINDVYTTTENITINQPAPGVLANDTDAEMEGLTAVLSNTVASGTLALTASGSFIYIPTADFCGVDNFTYHANDGADGSNLATVTLNVVCNPTYTIYLPLIMKPAAITNQTTPAINDLPIGLRPVTSTGETFYTQVIVVAFPLPSNGKFYLSSEIDMLAPAIVDDEVAIMLNSNEIFAYRYGQSGGGVSSALVEVPRSVMEQIPGETVTFEFRDVYGGNVAASEMYLVWTP